MMACGMAEEFVYKVLLFKLHLFYITSLSALVISLAKFFNFS